MGCNHVAVDAVCEVVVGCNHVAVDAVCEVVVGCNLLMRCVR